MSRVSSARLRGSLQPHVNPGDVVVCDQLVDRTTGTQRRSTTDPFTAHVSFADPYCAQMRPIAVKRCAI